jgi:cystathionine gamma-lyase/cystathionine beta-lyase/cystathionine gamma-lyase/homocysteine desulfhydrase
MGFLTDCIHAGQEPDPTTGAIITPIYQTSTYVQEGLGKHKGYEYARTQNPTRRALEMNLAALEGGEDAYCYASGMAATNAVLTLMKAGGRVVVSDNVYGGTHRLFKRVLEGYGIASTFIDLTDPDALDAAGPFGLLWVETPTNPLMKVCDIAALARKAHAQGAVLVVDNTFMSPALQRPLAHGADIVVHSTTKFLNGHSDSVGGVAIVASDSHGEWLRFVQNAAGAILSPFDSWLTLRGTKTLGLRMARHEENGAKIAGYLRERKGQKVYWPGFPDHPGHAVHKRQATGFGSMISFDLGSLEAARTFLGAVKLCSLGESLGGIETLISHPATMTHAGYTPAERAALGIGDGLVRISVGCEDADDLVADLEKAFEALAPRRS